MSRQVGESVCTSRSRWKHGTGSVLRDPMCTASVWEMCSGQRSQCYVFPLWHAAAAQVDGDSEEEQESPGTGEEEEDGDESDLVSGSAEAGGGGATAGPSLLSLAVP